jgi:hypothetical protein
MPRKKSVIVPTKIGTVHSSNSIRSKSGTLLRKASAGSDGYPTGLGGGSTSVAQAPLYYDYRYSTPDKFWYPRQRVVANSIWREIYKRDAVVAIATDMYAELPWSEFSIQGIDDPVAKHIYEDMFHELNLVPKFQNYTRDFLITGELILHAIFDDAKGYWTKVISHNPDYIRIIGTGLLTEDPLIYLKPTPEIRNIMQSADPRVRQLSKYLPSEVLSAFRSGKDLPLDPLNTTYIPRLNSEAQDIRGTSIYTRLYRVVMYEDFVVNASLAIAQRHAAPLRIFKLGNMSGDAKWLPTDDNIIAFTDMLSQAESDPLAAIVTHMDVNVELVGVSDKVLLISREWDYTERVKLLALGVSKNFLVGENSYAAAVAGLQVLMDRLSSLRYKFEQDWLIRKLCIPVAEINELYKRPQCEITNRVRVKTKDELQLLLPMISWKKDLNPAQDQGLLNLWTNLKQMGIISERTLANGAGINLDVERRNIQEEMKYKELHPEIVLQKTTEVPTSKPSMPNSPKKEKLPELPPSLEKETNYNVTTKEPKNIHLTDVIDQLKKSADKDIIEELEKAVKYLDLPRDTDSKFLTEDANDPLE